MHFAEMLISLNDSVIGIGKHWKISGGDLPDMTHPPVDLG